MDTLTVVLGIVKFYLSVIYLLPVAAASTLPHTK